MTSDQPPSLRIIAAVVCSQVAVTVLCLMAMGRSWWCECGEYVLWISGTTSSHTSQHLFDAYAFTHVTHGFAFWGLFAWALPQKSNSLKLILAVTLECLWEIAENTPIVIDRYRTATAALGYEGDTVANSLADVLACILGFLLARRCGWRVTVLMFILIEAILLATIRDSLLLNVLMLIYPIDAVRQWQLQ